MSFQSRTFFLLLYPDNHEHDKAISLIESSGFEYAYILHDMDVDESGEIKKAHIHCFLKCVNPKLSSTIANKFGIDERFVRKPGSEKSCLLYLVHGNDPDKYQYDIESVKGTSDLLSKLIRYKKTKGLDECEMLDKIVDFIRHHEHTGTWSAVYNFVSMNGFYSSYRRNYSIIKDIFNEVNHRDNDFSKYFR